MAENQQSEGNVQKQQHSQSAVSTADKAGSNMNDGGKSSSPAPSPGSSSGRRGRSRTRNPPRTRSSDNLRRRGYHTLISSFGKAFHVEKRWKLIREMGSGAYGYVISAADEISGEPVAIKMVTRATEKVQLAKRALREITLLRHFNHENITGLIDVDCTSDLSEIYIFMEPMEADLHQIIKSGQALTNEHVQYFVYQILRGMKYIHTASVVHRDLKPGNLLVNADCELKICDFGLARGFDSAPDENTTNMTDWAYTRLEGVTTQQVGVPDHDLQATVQGKGLRSAFDQLNKILEVLGTPDDEVIKRIGSQKAQAYIRSLPWNRTVPFSKLLPLADPQAIDLLAQMLTFDPAARITVSQALEHPWLASYHDVSDEPSSPDKFDRWRSIEALETLDQFKEALWNEIQDYRREVRSVGADILEQSPSPPDRVVEGVAEKMEQLQPPGAEEPPANRVSSTEAERGPGCQDKKSKERVDVVAQTPESHTTKTRADPVVAYARRSSMFLPSRTNSVYSAYSASQLRRQGTPSLTDGGASSAQGGSSVAFPTGQQDNYVVPARSRTASMYGGEAGRKLLRTLSTVSIYESGEGLAGGLADIAPIGKYIVERDEGLPSELPRELESPPQPRPQAVRKEQGDGGTEN
ncbi:hypothetical protein AcV7_007412 [Taiwanofungus camphoratus]|nr:hypothetical protein AcV7_007412 [Antrodia cinnamomea]